MTKTATVGKMDEYKVGDSDTRPWGKYEVIGVGIDENGEGYCEKEITVNPGQILSLQSHNNRRELWTVKKGTLEVVLNDKHHSIQSGNSISIPLQAIHCMANGGDEPCIVHERQIGQCSEDDIIRYIDAYGRGTLTSEDPIMKASIEQYNKVRELIKK